MEHAFLPQWPELSLRAGVLAYRLDPDDRPQFLLIRRHGRRWWSVPKGHLVTGRSLVQSALIEAYEEAGVHGEPGPAPLGSFEYLKLQAGLFQTDHLVEVVLFALEVIVELDHWPEMALRERRWFDREEAVHALPAGALRDLIAAFDPLPAMAPPPGPALRGFAALSQD